MKKNIVWLASYPKSGNTWTRIFLANYLANPEKPLPINAVHRFGLGDSIAKLYVTVGGPDFDVNDVDRTLMLRDRVLRGISANNADVNFVKTHNIRTPVLGVEMVPEQYTRSSIYIMRNPLDMLLSYARHFGMTHEETVEAIGRSDNANAAEPNMVAQFLGSWSDHVQSWTAAARYPHLALRYEDLLEAPHEHFGKMLTLIGIPIDEERLDRAVRFSSFDEVKKQEDEGGFAERSPNTESFFTKGKSGGWREELAPALVKQVKKDHRKVMKKYGYLE